MDDQTALHNLLMDMMCCTMCVDRKIDNNEIRTICSILKELKVPWNQHAVKNKLKEFTAKVRLYGLSKIIEQTINQIKVLRCSGQGRLLLACVDRVVRADGVIDPQEEKILAKFENVFSHLKTTSQDYDFEAEVHSWAKKERPVLSQVLPVQPHDTKAGKTFANIDAFISYATHDRTTAYQVCSELEKNGLQCWIAPRDILPGADYGASIVSAIHRSNSIVLIFSRHANKSSYVRREIERAVHWNIPIVPLRIEVVSPSEAMEFFLSTHQWQDIIEPPLEPHIRQLATKLRQMLSIPRNADKSSENLPPDNKSIGTSSNKEGAPAKHEGPTIYEQKYRLAYTMGLAGIGLIHFKDKMFSPANTVEAEQSYWQIFKYTCNQLDIKSQLEDYLKNVVMLESQQQTVAVNQHIFAPLAALINRTHDGRYTYFALMGICYNLLTLYLNFEVQGAKQVRPVCKEQFDKLILSVCQAQLPLDTINRVRTLQQKYNSSHDTVTLHTLRLELAELFGPFYVKEFEEG